VDQVYLSGYRERTSGLNKILKKSNWRWRFYPQHMWVTIIFALPFSSYKALNKAIFDLHSVPCTECGSGGFGSNFWIHCVLVIQPKLLSLAAPSKCLAVTRYRTSKFVPVVGQKCWSTTGTWNFDPQLVHWKKKTKLGQNWGKNTQN